MFSAQKQAMDRRRCGGNPTASPLQLQACGTTYDVASGQVYTEKRVRAPQKSRVNWITEYKTPSLIKRRRANKEGAASLFDMARTKAAREMRNLTAKHFEGLTPSVSKRLWDEVTDRYRVDSVDTLIKADVC
jgi:hypothetical protein